MSTMWIITEEKLIMAMQNPPHPGRHRKAAMPRTPRFDRDPGRRWFGRHEEGASGVGERVHGVSVDMAIRLSKAFGSTPETWLGMQMAYDLWQARDRAEDISVERFVAA